MVRKTFNSKAFWFTFAFATIIIMLSAINFSRAFRSTTDIIVVSKSPKAASEISSIVDNVKAIPLTLSFYDRMKQENEDITDEADEFSDQKRSNFWKSKIMTKRLEGSSIIRITIDGKNMSESQTLADQVKTDLIAQISSYYDIKNDIDIRVIDGPKIEEVSKYGYPLLFLISLISGFVISLASFSLMLPSYDKPKPQMTFRLKNENVDNARPLDDSEEIMIDFTQKPLIQSETDMKMTPGTEVKFEELPETVHTKTSSAPRNLPVGDEGDFLKTFGMNAVDLDEAPNITPRGDLKINGEIGEKSPIDREATPEEVKERLNKLLSGRFDNF